MAYVRQHVKMALTGDIGSNPQQIPDSKLTSTPRSHGGSKGGGKTAGRSKAPRK